MNIWLNLFLCTINRIAKARMSVWFRDLSLGLNCVELFCLVKSERVAYQPTRNNIELPEFSAHTSSQNFITLLINLAESNNGIYFLLVLFFSEIVLVVSRKDFPLAAISRRLIPRSWVWLRYILTRSFAVYYGALCVPVRLERIAHWQSWHISNTILRTL